MSWEVRVRTRLGALELDVELEGDDVPTVLIGPNGAGKTTLLRIIAGARSPDDGQIRIGRRTLVDTEQKLEVDPEERGVGYVPQGYGLFPHLRVVDNVAFGLSTGARRVPLPERRRAATELLTELGCAHLSNRVPRNLSGGEQQRVALARALIVEPHLLLLDEPLANLDPSSRRRLRAFLADHLAAREKPAIVVTHNARDAAALGTNFVVLEAGKIVQRGTPAELRAHPASEFVAEFFETPWTG